MEHANRMGNNATTHKRKRQRAKTNNKYGPDNTPTTKQNHANPNNQCVETSDDVPQSQQSTNTICKKPRT